MAITGILVWASSILGIGWFAHEADEKFNEGKITKKFVDTANNPADTAESAVIALAAKADALKDGGLEEKAEEFYDYARDDDGLAADAEELINAGRNKAESAYNTYQRTGKFEDTLRVAFTAEDDAALAAAAKEEEEEEALAAAAKEEEALAAAAKEEEAALAVASTSSPETSQEDFQSTAGGGEFTLKPEDISFWALLFEEGFSPGIFLGLLAFHITEDLDTAAQVAGWVPGYDGTKKDLQLAFTKASESEGDLIEYAIGAVLPDWVPI